MQSIDELPVNMLTHFLSVSHMQNALKVHVRTHSDVFPYECRICHRHFREKGSLQRHCRMHTGERPFHCHRCGRGFAEHGTLNRHLKAKGENVWPFFYAVLVGALFF